MAVVNTIAWQDRLDAVLLSWEGTPYHEFQARRGLGADCVRFVDSVLQELYGTTLPAPPRFPQNISLHDRRGAMAATHALARRFPNHVVRSRTVEPGDVIVYRRGRSPGHVGIIGSDVRKFWHASINAGVVFTSTLGVEDFIMRIYRPENKTSWA